GQPIKDPQKQLAPVERLSASTFYHPPRHQTVALGFLSFQLPASLIGRQLAQSLAGETEAAVVLVSFQIYDGASSKGKPPESFLNGEFHFPTHILKNDDGFYSLTLAIRAEDPPSP